MLETSLVASVSHSKKSLVRFVTSLVKSKNLKTTKTAIQWNLLVMILDASSNQSQVCLRNVCATTDPGGKAPPGANHLPWEWSKLPHLAGGRSQQNMTKLCEKLIYQVGPSHLCNKVYILDSTYGRILSFLGLMSNTWYLYDPLCTSHLSTAERCRFWENPGSSLARRASRSKV